MKTKLHLFLIALLLAWSFLLVQETIAQNAFPAGTFQRTYGTIGDDEAYAVCKTSDKGWAVAGYTNGFGTNKDFYCVKFDSNGVVKWSAHLNALGIESANGIKEAPNGDLLLVGNTKVSNLSTSYTDVLLARYSSNGTFLWQQIISATTTSNDEASELVILPNGNILISGSTNSTFSAGDAAVWITNSVGTLLSTKIYSRTGKEFFSDCELSYDGNILLCSPSTNGTIDIIWVFKMDYNGDTLWTRHYDYNYNFINVNAITEMLSRDIVIVGTERQGFGSSKGYIHIVDSVGNLKRHLPGLTLQSQIFDVSASRTAIPGTDDLFLMAGPYLSFQNRFGIASMDTTGFGVYWRFLDPATYSNYNYSIPDFNTATNAIITDVYDNFYIGSCIVGSSKLGAYGGLDFAIARSDFQETGSSYQAPCIASTTNSICDGDSVKLAITCNPKISQRWIRLGANANYNLSTDSIYYAKQPGIYCLAAFNTDSSMWLSNILIIDVLDTATASITVTGTNPFCGASGQNVVLSIPVSLFSTFQWYKDSILINGATNRTYTASTSGTYYCIRTNSCATVSSNSVVINADLAPTHFTFGSGGTFPNIIIIHPWCQSGVYDQPIFANANSSYSYEWYLTSAITGTQLISTSISCLPQDTGTLICITSNGCGIDTSDLIRVVDLGPSPPAPYQGGFYPPQPRIVNICPSPFSEVLTAPGVGFGQYTGPYVWYNNGVPVGFDSVYTVTGVGTYWVSTYDQNCSSFPINSGTVTYQYYTPQYPSSMTITASGTTVCQTPQYLYAQQFVGFSNWNYAWAKVGSTFSQGGDTLKLEPWMQSGDYYCTLSNGWCTYKLNSNIIHIDFVQSDLNSSLPPSLCSSPGGVSFSIANQIPGSTYQWYKDTTFNYLQGVPIPGATGSSYFASQAAAYYAEITKGGCTLFSSQKILSGPNPTLNFSFVTQPVCNLCNGAISVSASANVSTPQWENGSFSWFRNNLCPGTYIAHSTDVGGCVVSDTIVLLTQSPITISQTNAVMPTPANCDGQVTLTANGGTPPYNYVISPTPPLSGYCDATLYTVTVTDATGCTQTDTLFFVPDGLVWPGDANYDLIANNFDLFPIGINYGDTGGVRLNASNLWLGQPANDWVDSIGTVNSKHVDCNGDGIIDVDDTLAISMNYGLTHMRGTLIEPNLLTDPQLYFTTSIDTAQSGDQLLIPIKLGTTLLPVDSIYGIAFTINYSKPVVDSASVFAKFDSCWIGMLNSNLISIQKDNYSIGKFDLAIVRTDKLNQSGHGTIGILSVDMKDDLSGRTDIYKMLQLSFSNIKLIRFDGTEVLVNPLNDSIVVHDEITASMELAFLQHSIKIAPNPATNFVSIKFGKASSKVTEVAIYNTFGELMKQQNIENEAQVNLTIENLSSGIYFVKINTKEGVVVKKLTISK